MWKAFVSAGAVNLCTKNWWSTLLFIGNFATPGQYCFWHSWFLMVDMQLYFLSPLILYPLWKLRHRKWIVVPSIFIIASTSTIYILAMVINFDFRSSFLSSNIGHRDVLVHTITISRIGSWMMGILVGYVMHKFEGKTIKLSKSFVAIGWTFSLAVILTVIFAQYPLHQENFQENPILADAIYESLKGIFWCLAIGWIILACHLNQAGIAKRFLSLSVWMPISKLSFCIYLVHLPIQFIHMSSMRTPIYVSHFRVLYKFFGDFGVSFFVAFAWALLFEYPTLNIIAILLARRRLKQASHEVQQPAVITINWEWDKNSARKYLRTAHNCFCWECEPRCERSE